MSNRIERVNELIKRELSRIILREVDFSRDVLITITRVETSFDLNQSKVYISVIPQCQISKVLRILKRMIYNFQQKLNKRLKMKLTPKIKFIEEKETSKAARIEELLEKIKL